MAVTRNLLELDTGAPARMRSASAGESGDSVSIQTDSAWPTTTGTRTHVALTGSSGSSRIFRVSSRSFASSSNSTPSNSQSIRRRWSSGSSARRSSIASEPAPDTDWYVATRTLRSPAASWSGASTIVSGIVQQFGLAMIPRVLEGALAVHLGHDERDAVLEPEGRGLVDAERPGFSGDRDELAAPLRADREEADVEVARAESGLPWPPRPRSRRAVRRPSATRRTRGCLVYPRSTR